MTRKVMFLGVAAMAVFAGVSAVVAQSPNGTPSALQTASKGIGAMQRAAAADKYLFVFFWTEKSQQMSTMWSVFQTATGKLANRADSMAINVADPAEKPIVDKFGVRGAPMPLVLAIAPTGAATRAFPKQLDEAKLQQAFVSPGTAKCMKAIQDRHSILLCVQNDKTQLNQEAMQGVEAFKADPQYTRGTEIVVINPADDREQEFLKALQVDPRTPTAVTLVVTPPGAPVARFVGAVTKDQIETKVKEAQSSCGPACSCHH